MEDEKTATLKAEFKLLLEQQIGELRESQSGTNQVLRGLIRDIQANQEKMSSQLDSIGSTMDRLDRMVVLDNGRSLVSRMASSEQKISEIERARENSQRELRQVRVGLIVSVMSAVLIASFKFVT